MPLAGVLASLIFFGCGLDKKIVEPEEDCVHVWFPRKCILHPCIDKTHHPSQTLQVNLISERLMSQAIIFRLFPFSPAKAKGKRVASAKPESESPCGSCTLQTGWIQHTQGTVTVTADPFIISIFHKTES